MLIRELARILGDVDATHEGCAMATARHALEKMEGYTKPKEDDVKRLADILEAYAYELQTTPVEIRGDDKCVGEH